MPNWNELLGGSRKKCLNKKAETKKNPFIQMDTEDI